jgi:His-Xaa-Ser system radical SAM maturase HxsC
MDHLTSLKLRATPLHGRLAVSWDREPFVARITTDPARFRTGGTEILRKGDSVYLPHVRGKYDSQSGEPFDLPLPEELIYLSEGDVVRVNPRQRELWVMYRSSSASNAMLLTERCNSWCVMCSQPPRPDDDSELLNAWMDAIPLMDPATDDLGITGGEPTLLGDRFLALVAKCRLHLPDTALHVLSNGRLFNYLSLCQELKSVVPPKFMLGIPLYSDLAWQHDFVVQSDAAFDQTIRGVLNLARCQIPVEIRVVIHRFTAERLPALARFICRNLPFVQHVALMGLEPIGFARSNYASLWIDPLDYQDELGAAVGMFERQGMHVSIYNHQHCVLPESLWPHARQSISDWKNIYLLKCQDCTVRSRCGGFFHSAGARHSRGVHPFSESTEHRPSESVS